MNAKHALRIIERSIADAQECQHDAGLRARVFALQLSNELKACGEPLGERLAALVNTIPAGARGVA